MKLCPYCGYANQDHATECRKCEATLVAQAGTLYKSYWVGPVRARDVRNKALSVVVLGLLIKVYWGGYGPWPVIDTPPWASLRPTLETWLLYGGAVAYVLGWILSWI